MPNLSYRSFCVSSPDNGHTMKKQRLESYNFWTQALPNTLRICCLPKVLQKSMPRARSTECHCFYFPVWCSQHHKSDQIKDSTKAEWTHSQKACVYIWRWWRWSDDLFYLGTTKKINTLTQVHFITHANGSKFWVFLDIQTGTTGSGGMAWTIAIKTIQKLPVKWLDVRRVAKASTVLSYTSSWVCWCRWTETLCPQYVFAKQGYCTLTRTRSESTASQEADIMVQSTLNGMHVIS